MKNTIALKIGREDILSSHVSGGKHAEVRAQLTVQ